MKLKVQLLIIVSFLWYPIQTKAQIFHESTFFAVSKVSVNNENIFNTQNNKNTLHQYNAALNQWHLIGITGTTNIDAIAMDNIREILYAANGGIFGKINTATGEFTAIGDSNYGNGEFGRFLLNNIDGLTYCPLSNTLYASHHILGDYARSNDLLFKIDPANGEIIQNAMTDVNGNSTDYAVIEGVKHNCCELYDNSDLALHPFTNQLYTIQSNKDNNDVLTIIDPSTAQTQSVIYDLNGNDSKGLSFSTFGELFGSSTATNNFQIINTDYQFVQPLSTLDASQQYAEFHSIAYAGPYLDLALKITLAPNQQPPFIKDDLLTCTVTIYNQGRIEVNEIELINHVPEGLNVSDSNWIFKADNGRFALRTLNVNLSPDDSVNTNLQLKVEGTQHGNLINSTEILSAKNKDLLDLEFKILALSDIDSNSDKLADYENFIIDDEIIGRGEKVNEDEDDHDIVFIEVNTLNSICTNQINFSDNLLQSGTYQAAKEISANTVISNGENVDLKAGNCINLYSNFEVEKGGNLEAGIASCE